MIYNICAYYDVDLEKFYSPFPINQSVEDITEGVIDATKQGKVENAEFKELFHFGSFNTADGSFDLLAKPVKIAKLKDFVRKTENV